MLAVSKQLSGTWRVVRLGSSRGFLNSATERGWKNETPAGSSTEVGRHTTRLTRLTHQLLLN